MGKVFVGFSGGLDAMCADVKEIKKNANNTSKIKEMKEILKVAH